MFSSVIRIVVVAALFMIAALLIMSVNMHGLVALAFMQTFTASLIGISGGY